MNFRKKKKLKKGKITTCIICGIEIPEKEKACSSCLSFLNSLKKKPIKSRSLPSHPSPQLPPQLYSSREKSQGFNDDDDDKYYPYPFIFKPPEPPKDIIGATQLQVQRPIMDGGPEDAPFCKYCGAELPKGQLICHVCGKKVV